MWRRAISHKGQLFVIAVLNFLSSSNYATFRFASNAANNVGQVAPALLNTIFSAKTSQESLDASYALTNLILNTNGFRALRHYKIVDAIRKEAGNKKDGARRESAMIILGALFEKLLAKQKISEVVFLIQDGGLVGLALDGLADKGPPVRESAQYALDVLFNNLSPEALIAGLEPALTRHLGKATGKWQGTAGAYALLGRMADKAKIGTGSKEEENGKDLLRETMGKQLKGLIPIVESGMHDIKKEVCLASTFGHLL